MTDAPRIGVLILDDDFRVARLHAGIVDALPGFHVVAQVGSIADARAAVRGDTAVGLCLADVYLPDGSGIDLVAELPCDCFVVGAESDSAAVRRATRAGALTYLIKPFDDTELARRLAGYARYRRLLESGTVDQRQVDDALASIRFGGSSGRPAAASPTEERIVSLFADGAELFADDVSRTIGIAAPTARRHLANLVGAGRLVMTLQYGGTGRPRQVYRLA